MKGISPWGGIAVVACREGDASGSKAAKPIWYIVFVFTQVKLHTKSWLTSCLPDSGAFYAPLVAATLMRRSHRYWEVTSIVGWAAAKWAI